MATIITGTSLSTNTINGLATITLSGAPSETISYSGTFSGTVLLNSNGSGSVSLYYGVYNFTGSVSGYTKSNVPINYSQTVLVHPEKALYWYGKEFSALTLGYSNISGFSGTKYTNYFNLQCTNQNVNTSYFSIANYSTFQNWNNYNVIVQGSSPTNNSVYCNGSGVSLNNYSEKTKLTVMPTSITNPVTQIGGTMGYNGNLNFYAIWLD